MTRHPRSLRGLISLAVCAVAVAAGAGPAMAITPPPNLTVVEGSPTDAQVVTLTWGASTPDDGQTVTNYLVDAAASDNAPPNSPVSVAAGDPLTMTVGTALPGTYFLRVWAVQSDAAESARSVATLLVDRDAPTVTTSFVGSQGNGFYGPTLTIKLTCNDDNLPLPSGTCQDIPWTTDGKDITSATASVTDAAGRTTTVPVPKFSFDKTPPTKPAPSTTGEFWPDQPTFSWAPSIDSGSGVKKYEVQWQQDDENFDNTNGWKLLATVPHTGGSGDYSAPPALWSGDPLPLNTPMRWRVVAIDNVGARANSSATGLPFTIDPTVPAAPEITGGPSGPTRDSSPTFTWTGDGASFQWNITLAGSASKIRGGSGTSATVPDLADGAYVLHVTQFTIAQRESAEAIRPFTVDTTAPVAPAILTRPTFPSIGAIPTYTWATEPGAYSRWSVADSTGAVVVGPIETPVTTAELPQLPEGPYTFQVSQVDAAGNVSPATAEGFTVLAPLVAPTPAQNARTAFLAALPKQNALRLLPKAGTTLPTLRPLLRWKKGPRGTKLYNLQVFQVTPRKGTVKPKVTKVLSRFPRGRQFRPSNRNLKPNTCYVWRVWPYTGTAFTSRPVGVSNFCTAGPKVLRAKAAKAAATRAAARSRR